MITIAPASRFERYLLLTLFLTAVVLRLGGIAASCGLDTPPSAGSDEYEYDAIAWNLANGKGYRGVSPDVVNEDGSLREHLTAYRPPVTPLFYAAVYAVAGHSYLAAHVANCLLAGMTVLLVYGIARRVFGATEGWLAAGVYAFYPLAVYYNLTLLSETHGAFLVCLFVWLALPFLEPGGWRWAVAAGLALGALLLCKPGFVFLVPLLLVWAWVICRTNILLWSRALLILLLAGMVVLPWAVRNHLVMGTFIPFSNGGGSLLLQANNRIVVADPRYRGYAVWDTSLPEYAPILRAPNDECERDVIAKKLAVQWLRDNPDHWFYLLRGKFWRLWTPTYFGTQYRQFYSLVYMYYGTILVSFALSVLPVTAWLWRRRDPALILLAPIAATVVMVLVFHGQHRYRFPIDSLCIVIGAGGVTWLARSIARRSIGQDIGRQLMRGRTVAGLAIVTVLAAAYLIAQATDDRQIESYRDMLTRERLNAIEAAVAAYRVDTGRPPDRVEDLVPAYLPIAEDLHCPTHSLKYHDYLLLGSKKPADAAKVSSYRIEPIPGSSGQVRVVPIFGQPPSLAEAEPLSVGNR